jgi:aldose sugar dehydrogenase
MEWRGSLKVKTYIYAIVCTLAILAQGAQAQGVKIEEMASGLKQPWAIGFLPDGGWLITLRGGGLQSYRPDGRIVSVKNVPKVLARGQGGLFDVVVARDFAQSRTIFLSYSTRLRGSIGTVLSSAQLSQDGQRLENVKVLFEMQTPSNSNKQFGGRIVEAKDGTLFLTLGDRGDRDEAQNNNNHNGALVRIKRNGGVIANNKGTDWLPEIWSYGHRNPQGAALDQKGQLFVVEHGAKGGDEVNFVKRGANYGWPVIAYGRHYNGAKIGEGTRKAGMEQPEYYWDPSIAPSGLMIYSGKLWPAWTGDFFVGSLKFNYISRLEIKGGKMREVEKIASKETGRVRDVREAPDGSIWFLSVDKGAAFRIVPR